MSNGKQVDSAKSLEELSPIVLMPWALYVPAFDPYGTPHYKEPYRRYATRAHMKVAAGGLRKIYGEVKFYQYNSETERWEELKNG